MKKEGLSHIEVILGFVIFMIAIFFLLASYEPLFKNKTDESQLIQKLYMGFLENTSVEVREYYLFVDDPLLSQVAINLEEDLTGYGLIAIGEDGIVYGVGDVILSNGELCINNIRKSDDFITIRAVKNMTLNYPTYSCPPTPDKYRISTKLINDFVFAENVKKFNASYYASKELLKRSLNLPTSSDFEYNLSIDGVNYFGSDKKDGTRNIYSTSRKIKAVNNTGSIVDLEGVFRIW